MGLIMTIEILLVYENSLTAAFQHCPGGVMRFEGQRQDPFPNFTRETTVRGSSPKSHRSPFENGFAVTEIAFG
jgi:hypothetical protein